MKDSKFVFDYVDRLHYKCNKISLNCCGSINSKNNNDIYFHYALTIGLNYKTIENDLERITEIQPFIDQCKWK